MNPSLSPPFHELTPIPNFQNLCRDIFEKETTVSTSDVYGVSGQKQDGIDLIASREKNDGIEVGQCKCYKNFPPHEIIKASNEFLKYIDNWKKQNVKRFVLFVACDLEETNRQNEILKQTKRFKRHGIKYEAWSASTLQNRLAPHPDIVYRHTQSNEWVEKICGKISTQQPQISKSSRESELLLSIASSKVESLSSALSKEKSKKLDEFKELYLEGHLQSAYTCISELKEDENWDTFDKSLQAQILITLAGYEVNVNRKIEVAYQLVTEALQIDPKVNDSVIKAFICYHTNGAEFALQSIEHSSNIDLYNLKLGLLLELARSQEVISQLQNVPENININSETKRIHALALLDIGDINGSQTKIQQASYEQPKWRKIRSAKAIINYYSALSPAILSQSFNNYPEPVDWLWIKRDDQSLKRLREAESEFNQLAQTTERGHAQCQYWDIWRLACLANDPRPDNQTKAEAFCKKLLKTDPTNPHALSWAISRNYQVDLLHSQEILEKALKSKPDNLESITLLVWLYLNYDNAEDSINLLEQTKDNFKQNNSINIWQFWYVQALVSVGNHAKAIEVAITETLSIDSHPISTIALREKAIKTNDWQPFIEHLEKCFAESQDGRYLYECCQVKNELGDWIYVAHRANELIEQIKTPDALYLSVQCTWKAKQYSQCLQLLNNYKNLFSREVLPSDLRRWKIYCQEKLGLISEAVVNAENLARDDDNSNNLLTLIDLHYRKGDFRKLIIVARRLYRCENILPIHLLQTAKLVLIEDRKLAGKLWHKAVKSSIDIQAVGQVIDIGYKLGYDREIIPFLQQASATKNLETSPLKSFTFKEIISQQQEYQNFMNSVTKQYEKGEMPIHFVTEVGKVPLIKIFHELPVENIDKQTIHLAPAIMARHGSRPFPHLKAEFCSQWRLHLDISSFLLAAQINILDLVEQNFRPLRISPNFQAALQNQCEMLVHNQPSQLNIYQQIIKLNQANKLNQISLKFDITPEYKQLITEIDEHRAFLYERARIDEGYVVDILPLTKLNQESELELFTLSTQYQEQVINCRALAEALKRDGHLTDKEYNQAIEDLGDEGHKDIQSTLPLLDSTIFLSNVSANYLSRANLLEKVCRVFRVFVSPEVITEANQNLERQKISLQSLDWLKELIDRVNEGLEIGAYEVFTPSENFPVDEIEKQYPDNPNILALVDLFKINHQPNDVIWIDDRCFNKSVNISSTLIVGALEVISALYAMAEIGEDDYYTKIIELRAANIRYIPLTNDEIIFHLRNSSIIEGQVKENDNLSILKKYFASCLLDSRRLQNTFNKNVESNKKVLSETQFLFECLVAVLDSLISVWKDEEIEYLESQAYADWILQNLYTGTFGTRHFRTNTEDKDGIIFIGNDIAMLYLRGISFCNSSQDKHLQIYTRRQEYFDWLESRITNTRLKADPNIALAIGEIISDSINNLRLACLEENEQEQLYWRIILRQFYQDLPYYLAEILFDNSELMRWLGINRTDVINIESIAFSPNDFYQSITKVIDKFPNKIKSLEPQSQEFIVQRFKSDNSEKLYIEFKNNDDDHLFKISDDLFFLLSKDPNVRESVMRSRYLKFDCSKDTFEKLVNEIVSTTDGETRLKIAKEWQDKSATYFYSNLESKIINLKVDEKLTVNELVPKSLESLLKHFRFNTQDIEDNSFSQVVDELVLTLLSEIGLEDTLDRLASLPVKLPDTLIKEVEQLSKSDKQNLLEKFDVQWSSPVSKLHLIDLALQFADENELLFQLAQKTIDNLYTLESDKDHVRLFKAILHWVNNELGYWQEIKQITLPIKIALIWSHTTKIHNILGQSNISIEHLVEYFEKLGRYQSVNAEILDRDFKYWNDVLHPINIKRMDMTVHGLAAIISDKDSNIISKIDLHKVKMLAINTTVEGEKFPHVELWSDTLQLENQLNSFLGGDRGKYLSYLLGVNVGKFIEVDSLKEIVRDAINTLEDNYLAEQKWILLRGILHQSPIYQEYAAQLKDIIKKINIINFFKNNVLTTLEALLVISYQSQHIFAKAERNYWRQQLIHFAHLCNQYNILIDSDFHMKLLDCCYYLSIENDDIKQTNKIFVDLLKSILIKLPNFLQNISLFRIASELPLYQLSNFWELILLNRAL